MKNIQKIAQEILANREDRSGSEGWEFNTEAGANKFITWASDKLFYEYDNVEAKKNEDGKWFVPLLPQYEHQYKLLEKGVAKFD